MKRYPVFLLVPLYREIDGSNTSVIRLSVVSSESWIDPRNLGAESRTFANTYGFIMKRERECQSWRRELARLKIRRLGSGLPYFRKVFEVLCFRVIAKIKDLSLSDCRVQGMLWWDIFY